MTHAATAPNHPWLALVAMLAVQVLASLVMSSAAVLSPAIAPQLGIPAERLGWFVAVAYLFAMLSGLGCGQWVQRFGGVRVSQFALLLLAAGAALATLGTGTALMGAAVLIGAGYGLANPSAAAVLGRHAPVHASGLFFSIKQAGVPIGVALAGLTLPAGLHVMGWRASVALEWVVCLICAALLLATLSRLQPLHALAQPHAARPGWTTPLRVVIRDPMLRRLGLLSLVYAMTQQCFVTFLVSLLHIQVGMPLASAAGVLAASQAASTFSRIGLGHASDRRIAPLRLLAWLGLVMAGCMVLLALAGHFSLEMPAIVAALACAATAMGWNGVYFSALVRAVPASRLAEVSGATQFLTFAGGMLGPFAASQMVAFGGSYAQAMTAAALLPALMGLLTLRALRRAADQGFR